MTNVSWNDRKRVYPCSQPDNPRRFRLPQRPNGNMQPEAVIRPATSSNSGSNTAEEVGYWYINSSSRPNPVKSLKPNELIRHERQRVGLCEDYKNDYPKKDVVDQFGSTPGKNRVRRGRWLGQRECRPAAQRLPPAVWRRTCANALPVSVWCSPPIKLNRTCH